MNLSQKSLKNPLNIKEKLTYVKKIVLFDKFFRQKIIIRPLVNRKKVSVILISNENRQLYSI